MSSIQPLINQLTGKQDRPCRTMDSIRVSEAPDPGSIPGKATK